MTRTTPDQVKGIIQVKAGADLTPFIFSASELVTEVCVPAGYSEERLELIERYLAAHFYTLLEPRASSETAGPVSETLQSKVDLFLSTSHYGQHALVLDTAGGLARLNNAMQTNKGSRTIGVSWLGSPVSYPYRRRGCIPIE